jgi:dUTP pyrophosphatase
MVEKMQTSLEFECIHPEAIHPYYAHQYDSGMDLFSVEEVDIPPGKRRVISTGIVAYIPPGFELQVRPKSGLALNHGITVLNSPGTVDAGYDGIIKVILINHDDFNTYRVEVGSKIAQLVYAAVAYPVDRQIAEDGLRGQNGFGSTGSQKRIATFSQLGSTNNLNSSPF